MPGGLIESVVMGEKAGGDMQTISLQQFARIALVITLVPFIIQLWTGMKVGSAAGVAMPGAAQSIAVLDMLILALCVPLGMLGGRAIRLPASILVGPMILSALAHITGLTAAGPPGWAITLSQVIVGAGLGARFHGFSVSHILRTFTLSLVSVSMMFALGAGMVWVLSGFVDQPVEVLFISFAPGGVTETALIALSLNANPVYVTTLHVFRIVVTVVGTSFGFRLFAGKV
jgi:membrane AbrB-like protein